MLRHVQTSCYSPLSAGYGKHIVLTAITMLTARMTLTSGLVSTSRNSVNCNVFQKSLAPMALRQRSTSKIHAEATNTGGSKGGSITNSGKTAQPDSYEVCKAACVHVTCSIVPQQGCSIVATTRVANHGQPRYYLCMVMCMRISA